MEPSSSPDPSLHDTWGEMTFFNKVTFNPKFVLRLLSLLFSVVVFACVSAAGVDGASGECVFHGNNDACHFGIAIPLMAFVACLFFIGVDLQFNNMWNDIFRRYLLGCEFFFSLLWTFLWFVCFCLLGNEWRLTSIQSSSTSNHARTSIAFSFFSTFTWGGLCAMAWTRYKHIGGLQRAYETLPNNNNPNDDYSIEYSKDTSKYSIFPEVRNAHDESASFMYDQGPKYVVPVPTHVVVNVPTNTSRR